MVNSETGNHHGKLRADKLEESLKETKERLQEAEETLEAIRNGSVDGLVRRTPSGNQIFMLKGSEQPYRNLIEEMNEGAILLSDNGTILYCNRGFAKLLDAPLDRVMGRSIMDWLPQSSANTFTQLVSNVKTGTGKTVYNIALQTTKRQLIPTHISINKILIGSINASVLIITDLSKHMDEEVKSYTANLEFEIAERKKVEDNLRRSEEEKIDYLESMTDGFVAFDKSWRYTYINSNAARILHSSKKELIGKVANEAFPNASKFLEQFQKAVSSSLPVHFEEHYPEPLDIWYECHCYPTKDGLVVFFSDVTERKKTEEAIRISDERFRLALRNSTINVSSQNLELIYTWIYNPQLGFSTPEVVGKTDYDLLDSETAKKVIALKKKAMATKTQVRDEISTIYQNNQLYYDFTIEPLYDSQGKITGVNNIVVDITERKKAEKALEKATQQTEFDRQRLQTLLETTPSAVVVVEAPDGRFSFMNKRALALYGIDYLGVNLETNVAKIKAIKPDGTVVTTDEVPASRALWKGEVVRNEEWIIYQANGTPIPILVSAAPIRNAQGDIVSAVVIFEDITRQKKAEKALEEYSKNLEKLVDERTRELKAAERLASIGATAGMVGHDIRNPLQAIVSDLYIAKEELKGAPESESKDNTLESLDSIETNIFYINKIVSDLQDFARPLNPSVKDTNIRIVIAEALSNSKLPGNIEIQSKVDQGLEMIAGDSDFLKRIISNLVLNAAQAMPNGGKMIINTQLDKETNDIVLTVEDTGIGISEDVKDKLFTPMFTTKPKGQGFGLAVSKRMVEALGGNISYESEVGNGTKFIVRLPPPKELNGKWTFK